jgi:hypothetical protein
VRNWGITVGVETNRLRDMCRLGRGSIPETWFGGLSSVPVCIYIYISSGDAQLVFPEKTKLGIRDKIPFRRQKLNSFNGMDMSKGWRRGDYQKKY